MGSDTVEFWYEWIVLRISSLHLIVHGSFNVKVINLISHLVFMATYKKIKSKNFFNHEQVHSVSFVLLCSNGEYESWHSRTFTLFLLLSSANEDNKCLWNCAIFYPSFFKQDNWMHFSCCHLKWFIFIYAIWPVTFL